MNKIKEFLQKNWRYVASGAVLIIIAVVMLAFAGKRPEKSSDVSTAVTEVKVPKTYSTDVSPELSELVNKYYKAYASGDLETLKSVADPISEQELSYIEFYSQYIESIDNIKLYTKSGADESSTIVSAYIEMNYVDVDSNAPGLDFLYVRTRDNGSLYIDNLYGSFNQTNGIYDLDPQVTNVIAVFEQQDDVIALQKEVQQSCNDAFTNDESLSNFVNVTFKEAVIDWSTSYKTAEAVAAKQAEEAAKKAEEEAAKAADEEKAFYGVINNKVNVRSEASKESTKVGSIDKGEEIKIYGKEDGWYRFEYGSITAYVREDFVDLKEEEETESTKSADSSETKADDSNKKSDTETKTDDSNKKSDTETKTDDSNKKSDSETKTDDTNEKSDSEKKTDDTNKKSEDSTKKSEETAEAATGNGVLSEGDEITLQYSCNIRKERSETATKIAVAYQGSKVTVVMEYADGWTKVTYDGKEGYIKSSLLKD